MNLNKSSFEEYLDVLEIKYSQFITIDNYSSMTLSEKITYLEGLDSLANMTSGYEADISVVDNISYKEKIEKKSIQSYNEELELAVSTLFSNKVNEDFQNKLNEDSEDISNSDSGVKSISNTNDLDLLMKQAGLQLPLGITDNEVIDEEEVIYDSDGNIVTDFSDDNNEVIDWNEDSSLDDDDNEVINWGDDDDDNEVINWDNDDSEDDNAIDWDDDSEDDGTVDFDDDSDDDSEDENGINWDDDGDLDDDGDSLEDSEDDDDEGIDWDDDADDEVSFDDDNDDDEVINWDDDGDDADDEVSFDDGDDDESSISWDDDGDDEASTIPVKPPEVEKPEPVIKKISPENQRGIEDDTMDMINSFKDKLTIKKRK